MSLFSAVEMAPRDPILGLNEQYNADTNPNKVNLGVGVYFDDNGKLPLLQCVQAAEKAMMDKPAARGYLPIDGLAAYDNAVKALVFGADSAVVKDGRVVLNIAERAVAKLELGDDALRFSARFGGVSQNVVVPVPAVIAVYARETGQGMALPEDPHPTADAPLDEGDLDVGEDAAPSLALVSSDDDDGPGDDGGPETPRPPRRGNHLRVVK